MYIAFIYKAMGRKVNLSAYKKLLLTFRKDPLLPNRPDGLGNT